MCLFGVNGTNVFGPVVHGCCDLYHLYMFCVVFLSSVYALWPLVGLGGQFMIWLWCYNTIGLQWCCSSSLTLLAPPTGPVLPTLLLLCLLGSAPPCSHLAMCGWPMRRWRPWQPLPKRSVPLCTSPSPCFSPCQSCVSGCDCEYLGSGWWLLERSCTIWPLSPALWSSYEH